MNTVPKQLIAQLEQRAKYENRIMSIAALTGLRFKEIEPHIKGLTEFEFDLVKRAFGLGEFNPTRLNINAHYVLSYIIENGREIYDRQMQTARRVYEILSALQKRKLAKIEESLTKPQL